MAEDDDKQGENSSENGGDSASSGADKPEPYKTEPVKKGDDRAKGYNTKVIQEDRESD